MSHGGGAMAGFTPRSGVGIGSDPYCGSRPATLWRLQLTKGNARASARQQAVWSSAQT